MNKDVRWKQRFQNYTNVFELLSRLAANESPSEGERMGLIQAFEIIFELSWKLLGDYLKEMGYDLPGPRPIFKQAFQSNLIEEGHLWLHMLSNRNLTTHTYNEDIAISIENDIKEQYLPLFEQLNQSFAKKISNE